MKNIAYSFFFVLMTILIANSASAATYKGKCAKQAEAAAINLWANVPNPDPNLEYITISSEESAAGSANYVVVLAFSDGNQQAEGKYDVSFKDVKACAKPTAARAK